MKEKNEERIITLRNRVFRNKTKINHHKIYILMAIALLIFLLIFKTTLVNQYAGIISIAFILLVLSDILAIYYHKYWIKRWRQELTDITGENYNKLDELTDEYIDENKFKEFRAKYIKDNDIVLIYNTVVDCKNATFIQKAYLGCLNAVLRSYCETNGILNSYKIQNLPYIMDFCKKEIKHIEKQEKI